MNYENLNKLIDWLEAGAPHRVFSMTISNLPIDQVHYGDISLSASERRKFGNPDCGSVCCIAGAAAEFGGMKPGAYEDWCDVQNAALEYLGIDPSSTDMWMLPVFDPEFAPSSCSPQQAAAALKRWAENQPFHPEFNPWSEE